jgi:hypothetical protein
MKGGPDDCFRDVLTLPSVSHVSLSVLRNMRHRASSAGLRTPAPDSGLTTGYYVFHVMS